MTQGAVHVMSGISSFVMLLVGSYYGAVHVMSGMSIAIFVNIDDSDVKRYCGKNDHLTMANITESLRWPGCGLVTKMADFDTQCTKGGCIKRSTMEEMGAFNNKYGGRLVSYNSRPGEEHTGPGKGFPVSRLTGWWLPAPKHNAQTPRIVLQHGFKSNSNMFVQMFAAYQLRKLGFSVLVNNFRDHCYSEDSEARVVEWGHAYPYDTLGAWDYATSDPDNVMGGKLPDSKVGIMGFSMGGFVTGIAFGLEARVPAVWVDSPPFTPSSGFALGMRKRLEGFGIGFMSSLLIPPVWTNVEAAALAKGIDINRHTPEKELPKGPDTNRPISWVGNKDDDMVPFADGAKIADLLSKYPKKYTLTTMENQGFCNGIPHCADHLRDPAKYEKELCGFWTGVFGLGDTTCGLAPLSQRLLV